MAGLAGRGLKLYYAHAMCIYGTELEEEERKQIAEKFPGYEIVDPGEYEGNPEKSRNGMKYCFGLIKDCNALVFSKLLSKVTAGVGLEVTFALSKGIPVFELGSNGFRLVKKPVPYLSRDETITHYEFWRRVTGRM